MMNCFTLATGTQSPPGSESGSSRPGAGPISPPRRRASPSALSARPRPWRSNVPWPWSPRDVESSWPRTRAPRPCGSRRGTCRRGRPCATRRSRATGAGGREAGACVDFSEESRRWRGSFPSSGQVRSRSTVSLTATSRRLPNSPTNIASTHALQERRPLTERGERLRDLTKRAAVTHGL